MPCNPSTVRGYMPSVLALMPQISDAKNTTATATVNSNGKAMNVGKSLFFTVLLTFKNVHHARIFTAFACGAVRFKALNYTFDKRQR